MSSLRIEVAFNAGFTTPETDRVWTDISERGEGQEGLTITRGRGDERSVIDASTLTLTLDNTDGALTPENAASPYYPNVKKGRPIRITHIADDATEFIRFLGYVDSWPVQWPDGGEERSTITLGASSRQARLSQSAQLRSIVEEAILALGPIAYYPLGDAEGAQQALDASGNRRNAQVVGTGAAVVFGNATGVGTDGLTAATFSGGKYLAFQATGSLSAGQLTVFCFFTTSDSSGNSVAIDLAVKDAGGTVVGGLGVGVLLGAPYAVFVDPEAGTTMTRTGSVADGAVHFAAAVLDQAGSTLSLYSDAGLLSQVTIPVADPLGITWVAIDDATGCNSSVSHVGVVSRALSASEVSTVADAGLIAGKGEASGARITRLAALAKVPSSEVEVDAGLSTSLVNQHTEDSAVTDLMQAVADTESGAVFDSREGHLVFHDRGRRYEATTAFTLETGQDQVGPDLTPVLDDFGMCNDATATGNGGTISVRSFSQDSIDDYGSYRESRDLLTMSAAEVQAAADWLVGNYSDPAVRIPNVEVDLFNLDTASQAAVLTADLDTRFTLAGLPSQAPAASLDLIVEGYDETIAYDTHTITFNVSRGDIYDVLILDDPVRGLLDLYKLAY